MGASISQKSNGFSNKTVFLISLLRIVSEITKLLCLCHLLNYCLAELQLNQQGLLKELTCLSFGDFLKVEFYYIYTVMLKFFGIE